MTNDHSVTIVGLCGSSRRGSYNKVLLQAAVNYLPTDVKYVEAEIENLPFFNQDLEHSLPEQVIQYFKTISAADGFLICTPEYNYSIPGMLKNALEWATRPSSGFPLYEKTIAIIGASKGMFGPVRGHMHLRDILLGCGAVPLNRTEVYVNNVAAKITDQGELIDDGTHELLKRVVNALAETISNRGSRGA